ncbi:MAG: calcium/sodium antiporter [Chromatiales bacterium]|nr:calcium/sodium antiporter [Chromatiales bacterium]
MLALVEFVSGLALLILGAHQLVGGASALARGFGVSPLVVGLTVVAYGTSAPELAVSVQAALDGSPDIALGNVVGSNVCNVLVILGLSALAAPLVVTPRLLRLDMPLMVAASALVLVFALDGALSRVEGIALLAAAVAYTAYALLDARRGRGAPADGEAAPVESRGRSLLRMLVGLAMLVLGAHWLVEGAVLAARWLGVSELVIGLTVVAVGTSLPELATSVVAAWRGERDIAVGNVVGSNLFNLTTVLGLALTVAPAPIVIAPQTLAFDLPVMVAVALVCIPVGMSRMRFDRLEGGLLLATYALYVVLLALRGTGHALAPQPWAAALALGTALLLPSWLGWRTR